MSANGFCKSVTVKELGCIFPVAKHLTITFISKLTAVSDVGDCHEIDHKHYPGSSPSSLQFFLIS